MRSPASAYRTASENNEFHLMQCVDVENEANPGL